MPREIVLFVPGTSGVALKNRRTGKISWGRAPYILGWANYYPMQRPFRPGVEDQTTCGPVLDKVWLSHRLRIGIPFYEKCFRVLREQGGRHQGDIENLSPQADFYPWPYDWRYSLIEAAQQLDRTVKRLIEYHQDPDLKITLICHSNGSLAARHWWAFGGRDTTQCKTPPLPDFPRRRNLGRLILVGAPNRGTIKLLFDLTSGIKVVPLGRPYWPDFLFSMPPLYQSLPFDHEGLFADESDDPITFDLLNPEEWFRRRLGVFTMFPHYLDDPDVRAFHEQVLPDVRRFQSALDQPWPDEMVDTIHLIASRAFGTLKRMRLTASGIDLAHARATAHCAPWSEGCDRKWLAPGDWFGTFETLTGIPHRSEHMHEVQCIHRHLFSDEKAQRALVETLTED